MTERSRDPQVLALALGAEPVEPKLPLEAHVDDAMDALRRIMDTPAYQALAARRADGALDHDAFDAAVADLLREDVSADTGA